MNNEIKVFTDYNWPWEYEISVIGTIIIINSATRFNFEAGQRSIAVPETLQFSNEKIWVAKVKDKNLVVWGYDFEQALTRLKASYISFIK